MHVLLWTRHVVGRKTMYLSLSGGSNVLTGTYLTQRALSGHSTPYHVFRDGVWVQYGKNCWEKDAEKA